MGRCAKAFTLFTRRCPLNIRTAEFDQLFDAVVAEGNPPVEEPSPKGGAFAARKSLIDADLEQRISAAVALFHRRDYVQSLSLLRNLQDAADSDPRISAFMGACRAVVMGEVREGLQTCVQAVKRAFYIPDLYCALGVVLLRSGQRSKAYSAFQRGLRIDPRHKVLRAHLRDMGVRRRPVIRFLRRSHPANRVLGALRARVFSA